MILPIVFQNCGGFNSSVASRLNSGLEQPSACSPVAASTMPPYLGSRGSQAAYSQYASMVDSALSRDDLISAPSPSTPAVTRTFALPFVRSNADPNGCAEVTVQVQQPRPQPASNSFAMTIPCPSSSDPYADQTPAVAGAIATLESFQAAQNKSGNPSAIELDFVPGCQYYFISGSTKLSAPLTIPNLSDFTINGGNSLADAAHLIMANPTTLAPLGPSNAIGLYPASSPIASANFENAISVRSGGTRLMFSNLIFDYQTPIVSPTGVTDWTTNMPINDFGILSRDPSSPGHYMVTVHANAAKNLTYFNTYIKEIVNTDPTLPRAFPFSVPEYIVFHPTLTYTASATGLLELHGNQLDRFSPLFTSKSGAGVPVKIVHAVGPGVGDVQFSMIETAQNPLSDISFVNFQFIRTPGIAIAIRATKGVLFENLVASPTDGSYAGNSADSIDLDSGSDTILENSIFTDGGDDELDFATNNSTVISSDAATGTVVDDGAPDPPVVGDPVCFHTNDYQPLLCTSVTSIINNTTFTVSNANGLSSVQANDSFFRANRVSVRQYFSGNTFQNGIGHVVYNGNNAFFNNNIFNQVSGGALQIHPVFTSQWNLGSFPRNIVFSNNSVSQSGSEMYNATVFAGVTSGTTIGTAQVIQNILIQSNKIANGIEPAILVGAATQGVLITSDNSLQNIDLQQFSQTAFWQKMQSLFPGSSLGPITHLTSP